MTTTAGAGSGGAPAPPGETRAGRIGCGALSCVAGKQLCCTTSPPLGKDACIARRDGPIAVIKHFPGSPEITSTELPDADRCGAAGAGSALYYCDGSGDCPAGQVCCAEDAMALPGNLNRCVPARSGRQPCELAELCRGGDTCRIRSATCEDGRCVRHGQRLRCGQTTCSGDNPVCCASEDPSVAEADRYYCTEVNRSCSSRHATLECITSADCLPGDKCCASHEHSWCEHTCRSGTKACRSNADCVGETMSGTEGTRIPLPSCKPLRNQSGVGRACAMREELP